MRRYKDMILSSLKLMGPKDSDGKNIFEEWITNYEQKYSEIKKQKATRDAEIRKQKAKQDAY